ncbi:hypothetical protein AMK16_24550 [Streptomyces sp. CB00455]|uniref:hypothetical protein n=1 Tax=Streptomyces sp. CB00455 TaxID=1703927 RepID=UPI00093BAB62|nr:hypothetical protein [Streptomyces sp. CB00455]OKK16864.1 hypothetical protein AMK16_24550 [Streptomyces sp. CB00455]
MTENGQGSGQGSGPRSGAPWGPDPASGYPEHPGEQQAEQQQGDPVAQDPYGYPGGSAPGAAYGYPPQQPYPGSGAGHVVGPGYEGAGQPHGYGYPPLPEAVTQYIPPVPPAGVGQGHDEAATQYLPPVPAAPAGQGHDEAATQYLPPVPGGPAAPAHHEAATQYIPPVPAAPAAPAHHEAATQYIPPVPGGPAAPAHGEAATQYIPPVPATDGFDGLFRSDDPAGETRQLPPVQEPVLRPPPQRPYPPRRTQGPVPPQHLQQQPHHPHHPQPHPQFAPPPPPPPEAGRKVSPGIIAAVVIGLAVVGLGVGSLLGDGKPQNNDPGAVPPTSSASNGSAAPAGEAPVDPGRPQAVQLDKLLADSNDSRAAVIKAVDDIKSCKNLDQAAGDLRDAARQREELVTRLQELKVDQLPDNQQLTAALTRAWKSSAAADNSYAAWADDVDDDKGCKDGKAKNSENASAANKASGEATKAKESAATFWNAIANKYSLTKRDKSQL